MAKVSSGWQHAVEEAEISAEWRRLMGESHAADQQQGIRDGSEAAAAPALPSLDDTQVATEEDTVGAQAVDVSIELLDADDSLPKFKR